MAETAREALDRVARVMADRIADDADLRTPDQLEPGNIVKVGDEWAAFTGLTFDGDMFMVDEKNRPFTYPVSEGERFVWHEGAF